MHGEASADARFALLPALVRVDCFEQIEQGGAVVPVGAWRALDHVVAVQRGERDGANILHAHAPGEAGQFFDDRLVGAAVPIDEVHFVHAEDEVADAEQRGEVGVAAGLFDDAVAGVDQEQGEVGGGCAGDHVAGVLHVAGGVGEDEFAPGGLEVAVGDIDGDALLALGAEAVGKQGEVDVVHAARAARALDRFHLVDECLAGVEEQAADQGALAVVDGAGGGEPEDGWRGSPGVALGGDFSGGGHA